MRRSADRYDGSRSRIATLTGHALPTTSPQLQEAIALLRNGRIEEAARLCEGLLARNAKDAGAWHYLALARMQQGHLSKAAELLERSLAIDPMNANAFSDLGTIRVRLKQYEPAVALLSRALALNSRHVDALNNLAAAFNTLGRPQDALPLLERLQAERPDVAETSRSLGQTNMKLGNSERAVSYLREAVRLDPASARARIHLGEALEAEGHFKQAEMQYLNVLRRDPDDAVALARLLQSPEAQIEQHWVAKAHDRLQSPHLEEMQRIRLHVALGHFYDRRGEHDEAFANFRAGYDLQFARAPFSSAGYRQAVDFLIRTCTPEWFRALPGHDVSSEKPIFIVGMPRSGTTLMEQILASHSRVAAGGELSTIMNIGSQFHHMDRSYRPYPEGLPDARPADLARMAQRYLARLDQISTTAARVTDKQPFNFMHLALVAALFPGAKIIHCRRDPLDTCLSCYFVSFADEFQFASDLETLGNYYLDYHRLMKHWHEVLPVPILDVQYEDLVADTEKVVRSVLEHCHLPWEDSCLRFYETKRAVRTPSRWQVRQPMYSRSVGRWKKYERHLQPLKATLAPILQSSATP